MSINPAKKVPDNRAETPPVSPGADAADHTDILKVIASVESQLAQLRALREQQAAAVEEFDARQRALAEREDQIKRTQKDIEQRQASIDRKNTELDAMRKRLESRGQELERALNESREATRAIQDRLAESEKRMLDRQASLDARELELDQRSNHLEQTASSQQDAAESVERIKVIDAELAAVRAERDEAYRRVMELEQSESSAQVATRSAVAELEARVADLTDRLAKTSSELERARATGAEDANLQHADEIEKRDRALQLLTERLEAARRRIEALEKSPDAPKADPNAVERFPYDMLLRRERLRRYKELLRNQARKIIQAQNLLSRRQEEYEQLLTQRSRLAAAAATISKREQALQGRKARVRASAAVLYAVVTLAILAGLSWAVTVKLAPGQYAARAVIEADGRSRQLGDVELANWQDYHQRLVTDPALMEVVADRMKQRAIKSLASGAEVASLVRSSMTVESERPGQLILELRGTGPAKTQRVLDTFVTTLTGVANAGRAQRTDGALTAITMPARVPDAPLDDRRLIYAGVIWAASALTCLIAGLLIWTRLSHAKQRAEADALLADTLDEGHWPVVDAPRP